MSVITVVLIGLLLINEIVLYLGFTVESGVVIDHSKDSGYVIYLSLPNIFWKNCLKKPLHVLTK